MSSLVLFVRFRKDKTYHCLASSCRNQFRRVIFLPRKNIPVNYTLKSPASAELILLLPAAKILWVGPTNSYKEFKQVFGSMMLNCTLGNVHHNTVLLENPETETKCMKMCTLPFPLGQECSIFMPSSSANKLHHCKQNGKGRRIVSTKVNALWPL